MLKGVLGRTTISPGTPGGTALSSSSTSSTSTCGPGSPAVPGLRGPLSGVNETPRHSVCPYISPATGAAKRASKAAWSATGSPGTTASRNGYDASEGPAGWLRIALAIGGSSHNKVADSLRARDMKPDAENEGSKQTEPPGEVTACMRTAWAAPWNIWNGVKIRS